MCAGLEPRRLGQRMGGVQGRQRAEQLVGGPGHLLVRGPATRPGSRRPASGTRAACGLVGRLVGGSDGLGPLHDEIGPSPPPPAATCLMIPPRHSSLTVGVIRACSSVRPPTVTRRNSRCLARESWRSRRSRSVTVGASVGHGRISLRRRWMSSRRPPYGPLWSVSVLNRGILGMCPIRARGPCDCCRCCRPAGTGRAPSWPSGSRSRPGPCAGTSTGCGSWATRSKPSAGWTVATSWRPGRSCPPWSWTTRRRWPRRRPPLRRPVGHGARHRGVLGTGAGQGGPGHAVEAAATDRRAGGHDRARSLGGARPRGRRRRPGLPGPGLPGR